MTKWRADPGVLSDPRRLRIDAAFKSFITNGARILMSQYPGWDWHIVPSQRTGMVEFFTPLLSVKFGGRINIPREIRKSAMDQAILWRNMAGELLERFGCTRGPFTASSMNGVKRSPLTGAPVPHADDVGDRQQRQRASVERMIADGDIQIVDQGGGKCLAIYKNG